MSEAQDLILVGEQGLMERRRFSRIGFNMAAELTVDSMVYPFSQVENLGVGGCSLKTAAQFRVGTPCRFWLPFETTVKMGVEVFGEIVRCDEETVSVCFTKITPESLFHLQNVIRFNASDPDRIDDEIRHHPALR
ncbi:MAG: PilZ domain-containing protein [Proteobacteria bacterium]|nr:PilZ domain-containing protein [Pseudomonadota bacterium]